MEFGLYFTRAAVIGGFGLAALAARLLVRLHHMQHHDTMAFSLAYRLHNVMTLAGP